MQERMAAAAMALNSAALGSNSLSCLTNELRDLMMVCMIINFWIIIFFFLTGFCVFEREVGTFLLLFFCFGRDL